MFSKLSLWLSIGSCHRLDDNEISAIVSIEQIERVENSKSLAVNIDDNLTRPQKTYTDEIFKKVNFIHRICILKQLRSHISQVTAGKFYQGLLNHISPTCYYFVWHW